MRKLLLGTTALAAAATLTTNAALAEFSIAGSYEFKYLSRSSTDAVNDGTSYNHGDTDIVMNFVKKTDDGLTLTYRYDFGNAIADEGNQDVDEASLTIAGGFGTIVLGQDDDASDTYNQDEMDLIAEEPSISLISASISSSSSVTSTDALKIAYHLPAMGGLTAGISHADSGNAGTSDITAMGAKYSMDAGGAGITLSYATKQTDNATKDIDDSSMGVKITSGDITLLVSQGSYEADDEDRENMGAAVSYAMGNGMTIGAFTFKSEDDLDVGEEYTAAGAEVQYSISSGLTAVLTVIDYEYKATASNHEETAPGADSGTATQLTIKASF